MRQFSIKDNDGNIIDFGEHILQKPVNLVQKQARRNHCKIKF